MLMKSSQLMFFLLLLLGIFVVISSSNWFFIWVGLEINLMGFIPLMVMSKSKISSEAAMKYFLVQAISSLIFLFGVLTSFNLFFLFLDKNSLVILALWIKLAGAPFHYWSPMVSMGVSWTNVFILLTVQKISPILVVGLLDSSNEIILMILLSSMFGSFGGYNQINLKKLVAFSSISHLSWMVAGSLLSLKILFFYFFVYMLTLVPLFYLLSKLNLNLLSQIMSLDKKSSLLIFFQIFSMGGMPPMLGFFPKLMVLNYALMSGMFLVSLFLVISTLVNLFYYLRISYSLLMLSQISTLFNFNKINIGNFLFLIPMLGILVSPIMV